MPSLSSKDRVSLCLFTFEDGRRCRTPRISTSPHFCFYHAQKEAQVRASESLAKDLAYFFSGDYLSANDLNTALSRVFIAVARGDLKPRAARTLAYLAQTMLQTLHLAQNEFITTCGEADWRNTVVKSVNANHDYRFPPPADPQSPTACHPERSEGPRQDPIPPTSDETHPAVASPPACHPASHACREEQRKRSEAPQQDPTPSTIAETHAPAEAGLVYAQPRSAQPEPQPIAEPNPPATQTPQPAAQPQPTNPTPPPHRPTQPPNPYHYGPEYRLIVDGKPFSKH